MKRPIAGWIAWLHFMLDCLWSLFFMSKQMLYRRLMCIIAMIITVGCASPETVSHSNELSLSKRYDIWADSALHTFATARYYKPNTTSTTISALAHQFSPLIVLPSGKIKPYAHVGKGMPVPVVYVNENRILIGHRTYDQLTYSWSVAVPATYDPHLSSVPHKVDRHSVNRGLRITIGQDGFAVICEIIEPGSMYRRLFVSKSMESAAQKAFGDPLMGRRFSVEQGIELAPRAMVIGVFDDGPIPMGPYVYLDESRHITAIRCRCSSCLVDSFSEEFVYDFLTVEDGLSMDEGPLGNQKVSMEPLLRWPSEF